MASDRELRALHEASHAAAALHFGREVQSVSISPPALKWTPYRCGGLGDLDEAANDIAVLTIGVLAERLVEPHAGWGIPDDPGSDLTTAFAIACERLPAPEAAALVQLGKARAQGLLEDRSLALRVERLVRALLRNDELTGDEIAGVVLADLSPVSRKGAVAASPPAPGSRPGRASSSSLAAALPARAAKNGAPEAPAPARSLPVPSGRALTLQAHEAAA